MKPRKTPVRRIEKRKKRNYSEFIDGLSGSGSSDSGDDDEDNVDPKGSKRFKPDNSTPRGNEAVSIKKEGKRPTKPSSKA